MSEERRAARPEVLADVSEWAAQELAVALSLPHTDGRGPAHPVPDAGAPAAGALAALESGVLHTGHLWALLEKVAPIADRGVRERLEADLLAWVAGRSVTTPAQLDAKIGRELLARNVRSAARELEVALRRRGVRLRPDRVDGMAVLEALLTVPEARRCWTRSAATPTHWTTADGRARRGRAAQKMADCLMDLVLRPGETDLPPVQARLTLVAPVATMLGGDQPAEVAGTPVPAELARALAQGFGLLPGARRVDQRPRRAPARGSCRRQHRLCTGRRATRRGGPRSRRGRCAASGAGTRTRRRRNSNAAVGTARGYAPTRLGPPFDDRDEPVPVTLSAAPGRSPSPARSRRGGPRPMRPSRRPAWRTLALHRALARARRAVFTAELADRADQDAWERVPARADVGGGGRAGRARRTPPPSSAPRWAPCWSAPAGVGWSTGRGSRSPTH